MPMRVPMLGLGFAKLAAWVRTHSAQQTDYGEDLIGRVLEQSGQFGSLGIEPREITTTTIWVAGFYV